MYKVSRTADFLILLLTLAVSAPRFALAQVIELVPDAVSVKYHVPRAFRGFAVEYAGALYLLYQDTFARWDGHQTTVIPYPDSGEGVLPNHQPVVFRDKLYLLYRNAAEHYQLAQFDGKSLQLIPNPERDADVGDRFVVYRDKLYFGIGVVRASRTGLGVFDGDRVMEVGPGAFSTEHAVINHDKLYLNFTDRFSMIHIAEYDGTAAKIVKNPEVTTVGGDMIGYGDKVLVGYTNSAFGTQLGDRAAEPQKLIFSEA